MKYKNLSTDLKILEWFKKKPNTINDISDDNLHILEWVSLGYRGINSYKNNLITELIILGADINKTNKDCFSYILYNFLPLKKQPLNNSIVLEKILISDKLTSFQEYNNLFDFFINDYREHDFIDIKQQILFKNKTQITLEKLIDTFSNVESTNKIFINFCSNILFLLNVNQNISLNHISVVNSLPLIEIIKQKTPNIETCRSLLNQIEIVENYKLLSKELPIKQNSNPFLKI